MFGRYLGTYGIRHFFDTTLGRSEISTYTYIYTIDILYGIE